MDEIIFEPTREDLDNLAALINHAGWTRVFVPLLRQSIDNATTALLDPSRERKDSMTDDFLRGRIATAKALLLAGPAMVAEEMASRERVAEEAREAAGYAERAELGMFRPID